MGGAKLKLQQAPQGDKQTKTREKKVLIETEQKDRKKRKIGNRSMCISFTRLRFAEFRRSTRVPYYCARFIVK
jgi:hypothetical protein